MPLLSPENDAASGLEGAVCIFYRHVKCIHMRYLSRLSSAAIGKENHAPTGWVHATCPMPAHFVTQNSNDLFVSM